MPPSNSAEGRLICGCAVEAMPRSALALCTPASQAEEVSWLGSKIRWEAPNESLMSMQGVVNAARLPVLADCSIHSREANSTLFCVMPMALKLHLANSTSESGSNSDKPFSTEKIVLV